MLMQISIQDNMIVHQMDVETAYLHADIDYEIYLEQPEGFEIYDDYGEKLVCKLNKAIYGLKQSGRNWNQTFNNFITSEGFQ